MGPAKHAMVWPFLVCGSLNDSFGCDWARWGKQRPRSLTVFLSHTPGPFRGRWAKNGKICPEHGKIAHPIGIGPTNASTLWHRVSHRQVSPTVPENKGTNRETRDLCLCFLDGTTRGSKHTRKTLLVPSPRWWQTIAHHSGLSFGSSPPWFPVTTAQHPTRTFLCTPCHTTMPGHEAISFNLGS